MYGSSTRRDFISFTVAEDDLKDEKKQLQPRRQSCWRLWKQLPRLQRNVLTIMFFLVTMCAVYLLLLVPSSADFNSDQDLSRNHRIGADTLDKPPPPKVEEQVQPVVVEREQEQKRRKKGPPKLNRNLSNENEDGEDVEPVLHIPDEGVKVRDNKADEGVDLVKGPQDRSSSIYGPKNEKQRQIVAAFQHAWKGYRAHAWGHDELKPVSKSYSEWFHLGLTIIDSLDTMYIMGLNKEFEEARNWVENDMNITPNVDVNLFETTIRVLGSLLSAYHLSNDEIFLDKAKSLGNSLLPAFNTKSNVPFADVNLKTGRAHAPRWGPDSSVSEVSTIQIEFRELSFITKDNVYKNAVDRITNHLHSLSKQDGLVPIFINANTGKFRQHSTLTLGARADSYYEYLLKQWLQTGKSENIFKTDLEAAIVGVNKHLIRRSGPSNLVFVGELVNNVFSPKMDHLVCFLPGMLALAYYHGFEKSYLELAQNLANTCYQMYAQMPTFLSPEIAHFNMIPGTKEDIQVKPADAHNLLRPETIESLFYLYRITKNEVYRTWGWQIFEAFERYTKIPGGGYSSISNVKNPEKPSFRDKMESFFLGETLKYFFLLFSDESDLLPLDKYVFNSEGHPLPLRTKDGALLVR